MKATVGETVAATGRIPAPHRTRYAFPGPILSLTGRRVQRNDFALIDDSDAVAQVLGFIHEVGNEHNRLTLCPDRPDQFPCGPAGLRIQSAGQFIQKYDFPDR